MGSCPVKYCSKDLARKIFQNKDLEPGRCGFGPRNLTVDIARTMSGLRFLFPRSRLFVTRNRLSVVEKKMLGRQDLDRYATQLLSSSPPSTAECVKEFQAFPPGRAGICQFPGAETAGLFSDAPLGRKPLPVFAAGSLSNSDALLSQRLSPLVAFGLIVFCSRPNIAGTDFSTGLSSRMFMQ